MSSEEPPKTEEETPEEETAAAVGGDEGETAKEEESSAHFEPVVRCAFFVVFFLYWTISLFRGILVYPLSVHLLTYYFSCGFGSIGQIGRSRCQIGRRR